MINICSFGTFLIVFVSLTLVLLNQVCLKVDETILMVEKLKKSRKLKSDGTEATTKAEIKEHVKRITEMMASVNEWRDESQDLMHLNFLVEFLILSCCFALYLFTIFGKSAGSISAGSISLGLGLCILLIQPFLHWRTAWRNTQPHAMPLHGMD